MSTAPPTGEERRPRRIRRVPGPAHHPPSASLERRRLPAGGDDIRAALLSEASAALSSSPPASCTAPSGASSTPELHSLLEKMQGVGSLLLDIDRTELDPRRDVAALSLRRVPKMGGAAADPRKPQADEALSVTGSDCSLSASTATGASIAMLYDGLVVRGSCAREWPLFAHTCATLRRFSVPSSASPRPVRATQDAATLQAAAERREQEALEAALRVVAEQHASLISHHNGAGQQVQQGRPGLGTSSRVAVARVDGVEEDRAGVERAAAAAAPASARLDAGWGGVALRQPPPIPPSLLATGMPTGWVGLPQASGSGGAARENGHADWAGTGCSLHTAAGAARRGEASAPGVYTAAADRAEGHAWNKPPTDEAYRTPSA
eukprot:1406998-Prymnesium_polylepis.1